MRNIFLIIFTAWFVVNAQIVTVVDKVTQQALYGVLVISNHPYYATQSNARGQFEFAPFTEADSISLKLVGYETITLTPAEIIAQRYRVELNESMFRLTEVVVSTNRFASVKLDAAARVEKISMK
ncbi:MAG: carboxypeptidase-like regulatory domain-containing protein [Chitinophagales bacterium]|nr:carboxypeptidase-like regulatory domain-containing protein [Chitinophagales bacterium]